MRRGSTLFLRVVVFLIGLPIFVLFAWGLPWLLSHPANPAYAPMLYPLVAGIGMSAVPFYIALYQAFKLLSYIDKSNAFSELSVKSLKNIKICAIAVSIIYAAMLPFAYLLADLDDAPGLMAMALVATFAAAVIAVFAAVLQRLLQEAIAIKSENDLTV